MAYPSDFVIIIPDKTTTNVISWHQMDSHVVLDTRLVLCFTVFTIYGYAYSTEFAILRVLIDILHTVGRRPWRLQFTVGRYLIVHRRCLHSNIGYNAFIYFTFPVRGSNLL